MRGFRRVFVVLAMFFGVQGFHMFRFRVKVHGLGCGVWFKFGIRVQELGSAA